MTETMRFSLIKPTINTPFHIDFDWWRNHDQNWRVFLFSFLCAEHQSSFENLDQNTCIDWVDPLTAEISRIDGIQHALMAHCARQQGFLSETTTLVNAVFRVFLSNGNKPLTPAELSEIINKPPDKILQTLSGPRVYQGIRPLQIN
ncbi:MAG: hypothetical protein AB1453_15820 [Chloroflexota bacterium]|jgi:hypothetical protein